MNTEKMVNSKFYKVVEWFYRLVFLNLLILLTSFSLAAIPFLIYIYNEELGLLVIVAIFLFVVLFIPASIASFIVVKHYMDEGTGNVFVLYFRYLVDTIKRIYIIELILLPILLITLYGLYYYWQILGPEYYENNTYGYIAIISFVIEFFLLVILIFTYINLNFIMAYFRMKIFDYLKLSIKFSFKYMPQTLISVSILLLPVLLMFSLRMKFIPIFFILGISLPQFFIANLVRRKFNYLKRNLDDLNTENKYE